MIEFSKDFNHPLAIRYPRGTAFSGLKEWKTPIVFGKSEWIYQECDIALVAVGSMVETAIKVRDMLKEKEYHVSVINARFIRPLDEEIMIELNDHHSLIVTMEENVLNGGYGERVNRFVRELKLDMDVVQIAVPNQYVEHGNVDLLKKEIGLDADSIVRKIENRLKL